MKAKWSMGLKGSVLIANPVAAEKEIPFDTIEKHIIQALEAAEKNKITGKEITPFILQHIANNSNGESLETNIALIKSNAAVAANIAKAYISA
jgi:pseudouridine-5'-phosphate glycosidase